MMAYLMMMSLWLSQGQLEVEGHAEVRGRAVGEEVEGAGGVEVGEVAEVGEAKVSSTKLNGKYLK